ncbi:SH3 domain-containing protein [Scytonema hofmannii FACHB-248]|uniref:SH3 domain-containing protein n=1 Tax=Scytonema hofmannii FACHB-248 TaxID=1842502 RepID=A0ABR8GW91_9CYAN|nr:MULTISPECIES: SH3 domain-containing protein [Nostocales]MBD2607390.1 SH3 domain-containing protein [Scytonema hofmannii FACHB-248]
MANHDNLSNIIERILNGSQTQDDIEQLRRSLNMAGSVLQLVSQDGKFNTNIGQITGGEVHLGDRIYQGADAETIRQVLQQVLAENTDSAQIELPPIDANYRLIHYVITFLSLLSNLITWILLGFFAKSEFPIDYVWKLIVACLKGPEYLSKVLNKEQLKLYQIQQNAFLLEEKIKQGISGLNELNKREYSIDILERTIKRLYKEIESRDESIFRIIRKLERQKRLIQINLAPLKQREDPKLYKLEKLLQIITEGTTLLERDFERIEYILKSLSDKYNVSSQTPSTDSASNLLEELNQIINRNSQSMELSRLSTLKRVLYLLQWVFSSQNNSFYPDFSLIKSDNINEEKKILEDSTNYNLDDPPASDNNANQNTDINLANNSEESKQRIINRESWINLVNAQIEKALTETNAASPNWVEKVTQGIIKEWIKRVSIYGFDNQNLARIELAYDIDWNNQETKFWNSRSSERTINLDEAIEKFKVFSLERTLVVEFRVYYTHPENSDFYNKELGFSPAEPVKWATQGKVFKGLILELQKLVGIELFPKLSIELNFGPNIYRKATSSNSTYTDPSAGCIVAFGIALLFILLISLVSSNQESKISPFQQNSSKGGLSPTKHKQRISGVIQVNRSGVNAANLRLTPNGQKIGFLPNGTRVILGELSSDRRWRRVTTQDGRSGWLLAEFVQ